MRYIRPYIQASQRHDDCPRLTAEQLAAMDAYDAYVYDPDYRVEMTFEPGDIQFVNNYHVLHGRNAYEDDVEAGRVRWLKRHQKEEVRKLKIYAKTKGKKGHAYPGNLDAFIYMVLVDADVANDKMMEFLRNSTQLFEAISRS